MRISNSNPQPGEQQIGATIQSNNATKEGLAGQPTSDQRKGKKITAYWQRAWSSET